MLVIVIPTKDRRVLLQRALESVFAQTYENYRVVVINDGSTDGTREHLQSLNHPRLTIVHNDKSRGVNAARNAAFRTLREGEWVVPLDDDDLLLPGALEIVARGIAETPPNIQILSFNTLIRTAEGEFVGGYNFAEGEKWYEPSYKALMTGEGLRMHKGSEGRPVFKWTLFPAYLFEEDVNGFEGEWWLKVGRDNVGIRYLPGQIILIDWSHSGEHLSDTAARRNPASFARAHRRIFRDHAAFFAAHPRVARDRALHSFKIALRAFDPLLASYFALEYLRASVRLTFSKEQKQS